MNESRVPPTRETERELLAEAVRLLRVLAGPTIRTWLEPSLATGDERRVYQASTGGSSREVAAIANVSHVTVSNYWNRWATAAPRIVEETETKGRMRRLFDLDEIGFVAEEKN